MSDKSELKAELERKKQRLAQIREEKKRKEEERKKKEVCCCMLEGGFQCEHGKELLNLFKTFFKISESLNVILKILTFL